MKNFGKLALLGAALAVSATSAFATPISAGMQNVAIATIGSSSYTSGTLLTTISGTFTDPPPGLPVDYVAGYTEKVYEGGTGATCQTCLDFVWTVSDTSGSALESSSVSSFAAWTSNVFYVSSTGGAPAITTANDNISGSAIQFLFGDLGNGQSDTFVDFTNALEYGPGNISSQNNVGGNVGDYAPTTPEPSSLMLLGTGLVGGAGMLMRRRRQTV
jgi:hypothetical protein